MKAEMRAAGARCTCGGKGCSEFCAGELAAGRMPHPDGPCALGFDGRCERCRRATWAMKRDARQQQRRIDKRLAKQARRRRRGW